MKKIDLMNQKFGKLTVIAPAASDKHGQARWVCKCECGNIVTTVGHSLRQGHSKSCGCTRNEKIKHLNAKHFMSKTRLYKSWQDMKDRCYNTKNKYYHVYGGRGISVCDDWKNSFECFRDWAIENGYSDELTIDRINPNSNYCPENCRWTTQLVQANNRTNLHMVSYHGQTDSLSNMCRKLNINTKVVYSRMNRKNCTFEQAIDDFEYRPPFKEYWKNQN